MAKSESTHEFLFLQKKPMLIVMGDSWEDRLEDKITFWPNGKEMAIHLSRENLKKLYILIQERLKGGSEQKLCSFTEDGKFFHYSKDGETVEIPTEEALRGSL